jgi:pimeloyl-ACP methyl ester carboxylesterase
MADTVVIIELTGCEAGASRTGVPGPEFGYEETLYGGRSTVPLHCCDGNRLPGRRLAAGVVFLAALLGFCGTLQAAPEEKSIGSGNNADTQEKTTMRTLGGKQFWGDVLFFHDWKIQRNIFSGHYRLLDGKNNRLAWGTLNECKQRLDEIRRERNLPAMSGKAVILLHGIIRSSRSFTRMRDRLKDEGYLVFGFEYPSTRVDIPESAAYLHSVIESLDGVEEINFVVHSMGGLVVRAYLSKHEDPRIRRMVMIGVPNLGAHMADHLRKNLLYRTFFGPAGQQLVCDTDGLIAGLPIPNFEFAVIAGGRENDNGYNPIIPGDDDGTVCVESTRLPGAADFGIVHGIHSFLMNHETVVDYTVRFLETGRLRAEGDPQPIPRPEPDEVMSEVESDE